MMQTLQTYNETAVPPGNKPIDPRGDPKFYDYTWTNWLDIVDPLNETELLEVERMEEERMAEKRSALAMMVSEKDIQGWLMEEYGTKILGKGRN